MHELESRKHRTGKMRIVADSLSYLLNRLMHQVFVRKGRKGHQYMCDCQPPRTNSFIRPGKVSCIEEALSEAKLEEACE
jgi:hypothetical protein